MLLSAITPAVRGFELWLGLLLALAAAHKLAVLARGEARSEPILTGLPMRFPSAALGTATAAELLALGCLIFLPIAGLVVAACLLALYTRVLSATSAATCNCFGAFSGGSTPATAVRRNLALITCAAAAMAVHVVEQPLQADIPGEALAVTAILSSAALGRVTLKRLLEPQRSTRSEAT